MPKNRQLGADTEQYHYFDFTSERKGEIVIATIMTVEGSKVGINVVAPFAYYRERKALVISIDFDKIRVDTSIEFSDIVTPSQKQILTDNYNRTIATGDYSQMIRETRMQLSATDGCFQILQLNDLKLVFDTPRAGKTELFRSEE